MTVISRSSTIWRGVVALLSMIVLCCQFFLFAPMHAQATSAPSGFLDTCDSLDGWTSENTLSLDTQDKLQGTASLVTSGTQSTLFSKKFDTPVDSHVNNLYGVLQLWIKVSDMSAFDPNSTGAITIASSGSSTQDAYTWDAAKFITPDLRTGWTILTLQLRKAQKIGSPNLSAINWFEYRQGLRSSVTVNIDAIRFASIQMPYENAGIVFDPANSTAGWSTGNGNILGIDGDDTKFSNASLTSTYGGNDQFFIKKLSTPFNTTVNEANGSMSLWLYVPDVTKLGSGQIELSSAGTSDTNEYNWDFQSQITPSLKNGWTHLTLPLASATRIGNPDLTSLNWFRLYNDVTAPLTFKMSLISFDSQDIFPVSTLDHADSLNGWSGNNPVTLDTTNEREGTGCLSETGQNIDQFEKSFSTPLNTGVNEQNGYLQFWYYISDVSQINNATGQIEITSSGIYDTNEYDWSMYYDVLPQLHNGWNFVSLPLAHAGKVGNPDLSAINWFRIYQKISAPVTAKLDDIRFATSGQYPTLYPQLTGAPSRPAHPQVQKLSLPSDDIPLAAFNVTDYGAVANNDSVDNTAAFQNALNDAEKVGGAAVFVPAGQYHISGHLVIPSGVTLRGDWQSPEEGGSGKGTILKAYEGQDNLKGYPFISTQSGAVVRDLTIWYPEQNDINNVHKYPWTIRISASGGWGPTLSDLTLVNSYNGIKVDHGACPLLKNIYGTVLNQGASFDGIADIGRRQTVWFRPKYWANSGLGMTPSEPMITAYTQKASIGMTFLRDDWGMNDDLYIEGYYKGIVFALSSDGSSGYTGTMENVTITGGIIGIDAAYILGGERAVLFSNCSINATGPNGVAIQTETTLPAGRVLSFNGCTFNVPRGVIAKNDGPGTLNFVHNVLKNWSPDQSAIVANAGSLQLDSNTFQVNKPDVQMAPQVTSAVIVRDTYADNEPHITNQSHGDIKIDTSAGTPATLPKLPSEVPAYGTYPKPPTNNLYVVTTYGAVADGTTDDTAAFQQALDAAAAAGGGTVYVPAGRYMINTHLNIGSNVELRGPIDGPHHYGEVTNQGAILLAIENQGNSDGTPFITLGQHAGVRGINIFYPNQQYDHYQSYPWAIKSTSLDSYVIDVTIPDAYNGLDFEAGNYYALENRIFGLHIGTQVANTSTPGYLLSDHPTMGDWQDGIREANAPPPNLWQTTPSFLGPIEFYLHNASNAILVEDFSFGADTGLKIDGTSSNNMLHQFGADNAKTSAVIDGSGTNNTFIDAQLVAISRQTGTGYRYLFTPSTFTGSFAMFNSASWGDHDAGVEIQGSGNVLLQQWIGDDGTYDFKGGTVLFEDSASTVNPNQVTFESSLKRGVATACIGSNKGFGVSNNNNSTEIWNNILGSYAQ